MPMLYLSPSTQEANPYITGGNEEYYMNLIADAMEPYLEASNITFTRNTPQMTAASSIRQANSGDYQLYLAIHSNAAPDRLSGQLRGTDIFYYPNSTKGRRFADIIAENFKEIYPEPQLVDVRSTTALGEVRQPNAPSVLVEVAYHDNTEDAQWITQNINTIAEALAKSVAEYFGVPFITPSGQTIGTVTLNSGNLNIRSKPSINSPIISRAANGEKVIILGEEGNWYFIDYGGTRGYAVKQYIRTA